MDDQNETILLIATSMVVLVLFAFAVLVVMVIYRKRKVEHERQLFETRLAVQQQTMQDIGQEIHDNVAQQFTLVFLKIHHMLYSGDVTKDKLMDVEHIVNAGLLDLRNVSRSLTDSEFLECDLGDLIDRECQKVRSMTTCMLNFHDDAGPLELPASSKRSILRILQEFMSNSLRHSQCGTIDVQIKRTETGVDIRCMDDGKGFLRLEEFQGSGIKNMARRAGLLGCHFDLTSTPGQGTTLHLFIPQTNPRNDA